MIDVSKKLKQLRIDGGIAKSRLVTYLSITLRTYDRYEDGSRTPDLVTLMKLSDFYQCSLDELVKGNTNDTLVDRALIVSYRDLKDKGLNDKLAHGLVKQVYDTYEFEKIPQISDANRIKFIYKEDLVTLLESIVLKIQEEKKCD
ncbi:TPA: helix-turn-helix transcriptional regulator [Streptococcus pyogenes]|uniref:helix-turn-helix domain-containing protein n=1 Tax=Streptococcus dysgalactiae TaxID=1334 RepID=UPI0010CAC4BD|nr:helix-turn-helix transcriptional regulator [Streptococcus dysgalactiae]MCB2838254.1 helix-turn-helix domain-containing protein [Streptococcus dysgalactiae subsp. dysgalactiae]MDY2963166.1 helix-turn-helix transcriptional regulator [Streptococcus dysgalactiae]VTS96451.1 HTH-type transcriptional regulator dicA [Streptococcus dysgalactiae]